MNRTLNTTLLHVIFIEQCQLQDWKIYQPASQLLIARLQVPYFTPLEPRAIRVCASANGRFCYTTGECSSYCCQRLWEFACGIFTNSAVWYQAWGPSKISQSASQSIKQINSNNMLEHCASPACLRWQVDAFMLGMRKLHGLMQARISWLNCWTSELTGFWIQFWMFIVHNFFRQ